MPLNNQKGFAQVFVLLLLLVGLVAGVYLVQTQTNLKPKASELTISKTAGYTVSAQPNIDLNSEAVMGLALHSPVEPVSFFLIKLKFSVNDFEALRVTTNDAAAVVTNWSQPVLDNTNGYVLLYGSAPGGVKTASYSEPKYLANVYFKPKRAGTNLFISYEPTSMILRSSDYADILNMVYTAGGAGFNVQDPNATTSPTPTPTPTSSPTPAASSKKVFVTSTTYNGNLGGLSGADAKCQDRANAANLGGTWKAWISTGLVNALTRAVGLSYTGKFTLVDGTVVATDRFELTSGYLQHAIDKDELGNVRGGDYAYVWTNTNYGGGIRDINQNSHCGEWTRSTYLNPSGYIGIAGKIDRQWTDSGNQWSCEQQAALYCFEQ